VRVIAIEPYGSVGLLRSVCVAAPSRSVGLGRRLVQQVEAIARARRIGELFLLTESTTEWFPRLGHSPDDRSAVRWTFRLRPS
jgi:amino-acid N-acetyltransferase